MRMGAWTVDVMKKNSVSAELEGPMGIGIGIGIDISSTDLALVQYRALVNTSSGETSYQTSGGAMVVATASAINRILEL